MQIKMHNYEIMNFDSQVFVNSTKGISNITSGPMAAFLSELRGCAGQNISPDHIENELARYGLDIEPQCFYAENPKWCRSHDTYEVDHKAGYSQKGTFYSAGVNTCNDLP